MNDEPVSLKEYLPFLSLLMASIFVFSAMNEKGKAINPANLALNSSLENSFLEKPDQVAVVRTDLFQTASFPQLSSRSYIVRIIGEKKNLFSRLSWKPMPPASLTKILTALLAYEELSSGERIRFSEEARRVEGKVSSAKAGEIFARNDVIRMALVGSTNDAALVLAEAVGKKRGGVAFEDQIRLFVGRMNERARELGMKNSEFKNPTGLDEDGHLSTAEDLALLVEYMWLHYRSLWESSRLISVEVSSENGNIHKIVNTNELLKEFPAILGGKTGFTDEARGTLVLLYPIRSAKVAIIVILGSDDRFGDGRKIIRWLEENF